MYVEGYRSIKVPEWVYANCKQAELALRRHGPELPLPKELLAPAVCPACGGRMSRLEVQYEYRACQRCGYTQQDLSVTGTFFAGTVLGLGLALLLSQLSQGRPSRRRPRRRRR